MLQRICHTDPLYWGGVPHSGSTVAPELLSTDVRKGRLTLNVFASVLPKQEDSELQTVRFGKTGLKVSKLCFGTPALPQTRVPNRAGSEGPKAAKKTATSMDTIPMTESVVTAGITAPAWSVSDTM